jgi:hypothetical protein
VNHLLDEFTEIIPEMINEIELTKNKFPTISTFSKFNLKWKLTNYLTYIKEHDRREILNEDRNKHLNFMNFIIKSREVVGWLEENQFEKYNDYFNWLTFINFGQAIKRPYIQQSGSRIDG